MIGFGGFTGSDVSVTSFANKITNSIFSSLGCPTLSSLGLSIGNIIKLLRSNSEEVTTELKDITLQTSTYNKVIPEIFGRMRIAGNLIWCSKITKTSIYHSQKTTKHGTESAYTEYYVRGSFAIAICKGKIDDIKNIYADSEPLNLSEINVRIYKGDNLQTADPTMQSYLGTEIPAFRGLCYAVFTDFPMENFGGRIPNFTFDVVRKKEIQKDEDMEDLVSAITIIPGSGEFVYDTDTQKNFNGSWFDGRFYETSKSTILNNHTPTKYTDSIDSLNELCDTFPNLKWVSLVVCWFCDNLNSDFASVYPACENRQSYTLPDEWSVAGKNRQTARTVGLDDKGNIRFGGTPSDSSVLRYAKKIKEKGLKLCLYPMLMVDVDQKPWRGHMYGSPDKIHDFFTKENGYNNFIKHYTNLLRNEIDAVIIGTEMKKLTSVFNENTNTYPAVDEFCNLAGEIRNMVKSGTKITYAADWSEYHHNDNGIYNLDKLWAHKDIDYIGIDAYFPLTDRADTTYNIEEIKNGWRSGEGWDFYYADEARTEKKSLSPEWAWKNVEYFWSNKHYNPDGTQTAWIPKSKKIWFTEYGFPSVDCCTNQPNVFYSQGSYDSGFPRYSTGCVDFKAQRIAIMASEQAWRNNECVEEMFLYTWDARPYPYFPNLKDVWADADCWKYGHFLNGKIGTASLASIIDYLCTNVGLEEGEFDTSLLKNEIIEGFILNDKKNILNHLKVLATTYNFDAFIDGGKIYFKSLKDTQNHIINTENLIIDAKTKKLAFTTESHGDETLPTTIELLYIDISKDYSVSTAIAKNINTNSNHCGFSVQIPMNISQAQEIAWRILSNISNQKTNYLLRLPITFLDISPLDTIIINHDNEQHLIRVKNIEVIEGTILQIIGISIVANENILASIDYKDEQTTHSTEETTGYIANTNFNFIELYNIHNEISNDTFTLHCPIWSEDKNWTGASLYYSDDDEENYQPLKYINTETSVGKLISIKQSKNITPNFIDKSTEITFTLLNEDMKLQTSSEEDFLSLKNKILIGNEIVVFKNIENIGTNTFKISYLLRGRYNTENEIFSHTSGEQVILLDNDLLSMDIPSTLKGKTIYLKAVSNGNSLKDTTSKKITANALSCIDYDVKNCNKTFFKNGDILLSFSPRKRFKLNNNDNVVLTNNLLLTILNKDNLIVRKTQLQNTNRFIYTTNMQIEDFGKKINISDITYKVDNLLVV